MGNSLTNPADQPDGKIFHPLSSTKITIQHQSGEMLHRLEHEGFSATYPIAYGVGAGQVGYSYMVRIGNYLFQSPASYYTQRQMWDVTPGYESEKLLDFTHPILSGCLFCHVNKVNLIPGTENQYQNPAFTPISCERCHGDATEHLRRPVPGSIVNPAKLAIRERDSVCEQCHLEGHERILNAGRDWWDFKPGAELENTFAIYLDTRRRSTRAVSQVEHLAESQCARASGGKLWCGSCHDPHGDPANRARQIRQVCLSCHESLFTSAKHASADQCTSCHMPRIRPDNIAHAEITDHRIVRRPREPDQETDASDTVKAWHEPAPELRIRDLGLAYFSEGAKLHDDSMLRRSYELLSKLPVNERDSEVLADLGSVLLRAGQPGIAIQLFRAACDKAPQNGRLAYILGAALEDAKEPAAAVLELKRSIAIDPSSPDPYIRLAQIYQKENNPSSEKQVLSQYLRFMPQNVRFNTLK